VMVKIKYEIVETQVLK